MRQKMLFSKKCNYCTGNKLIYRAEGSDQAIRLLRQARGYIDAADVQENVVQYKLATAIDKLLKANKGRKAKAS